ncbi:RHS repeat-associated core domain-containing protein, partial [Leptospira sp. 201903070]
RESGFYFYNARYYDPGIARFTSADTVIPDEHNSQAWNRFAYVYNNPIGVKDPTGHVPQKSCGPEYCGGGLGGGSDSRGWGNSSKNSDAGQGPSSGGVRGSSSGSGSGIKGSNVNNGSTRTNAKGSTSVSNNSKTTSRAARREAMRKEGIPTSQQPKSQSKNASGREYQYEVPKNGGGRQTKSVQQQTMDRSHPNEKHWEAGKVKTDDLSGKIRYNNHGRPQLTNDKSKINYE